MLAASDIVGRDHRVVLAEINLVGLDEALERPPIILVSLSDVGPYRFHMLLPGWLVSQVKDAKR